jgi:tetratricopeptide (TPR) repeat protein
VQATNDDAEDHVSSGKHTPKEFIGRAAEVELLSAELLSDKNGTTAIAFWAPSGMGKTSLLAIFQHEIQQKWNRQRNIYPLAYLDFADSFQSGNPLESCIELNRQLNPVLGWRCLRFELLWACLVSQRGFQPVSLSSRRHAAADASSSLFDMASAWLDAAAHIPFVGAVTTTGKLAAKLTHAYLEKRHVQGLRDWFFDTGALSTEQAGRRSESLQARLYAADPTVLERLIPSAFAADLADWAHERAAQGSNEQRRLVLILDGYERLVPHQRSQASATFPYQLVRALYHQNVPALVVVASQNPVRWRLGETTLAEDRQLSGLVAAETREYLTSRHVTDEVLTERIHLLTRGCPGLIAALLDITYHENVAAMWDRLDEVNEELDGMDPTSSEGRGRFMSWYVGRLEQQMAAEHAHLFGFVVAGSALRSFDVGVMRDVVSTAYGTQAALTKLSKYSFLQELVTNAPIQGASPRPAFRERRFRIHDLVRQAVQLSETYAAEVAETHQHALAYYDELAREPDTGEQRASVAEVVYHQTCLNADTGLQKAEELFRNSINAHDLTMCDFLVEALMDAPIVEPISHARVLVLDGRRQRARSMYGEAIEYLTQAKIEAQRGAVVTRLQIEIVRNLAECYRLHGEPQHAYEEWDELAQVGERTGDAGVRFLAAEGRLRSHIDHDEQDLAMRYAARARRLLKNLETNGSPLFPELVGNQLQIRRAHLNRQLTRAYRFSGDYARALKFSKEAVSIYQHQDDDYHLAWALVGLGHIYRGAGKLIEAQACSTRAMNVFQPSAQTDRHADPQGISKATQLLLLTILVEDEPVNSAGTPGPNPGTAGPVSVVSELGKSDKFSMLTEELLMVNQSGIVDPYAPIYANFALAEKNRHLGLHMEAEGRYEETIKACEKIDGRAEAAYARLGEAELWRCYAKDTRQDERLTTVRIALLDGQVAGYPWIEFYAAIEMALLRTPEGAAHWLEQAEQAAKRIIYPYGPHRQKKLLSIVERALTTDQLVPPIFFNVP